MLHALSYFSWSEKPCVAPAIQRLWLTQSMPMKIDFIPRSVLMDHCVL